MIIAVKYTDTNQLTEIALTSKAFWGYSKEQLESWREELTVTQKMVKEMMIYKFLQNDKIVGFYILNQPKEYTIELEFLFVLPEFIGKGIGKRLLRHSFEKAKEFGCTEMTLLADPNAEAFYKSQGFDTIEQKESSIFNRFLPVMKKGLKFQK